MARVTVSRQWGEGDILRVSVEVPASYPDSLDEAGLAVLKRYTEALLVTLDAEAEDNPDE